MSFLLKRFDFYTSVFKQFTHLEYIIIHMPHLNKTNNFAFDHTDNGHQPGNPLTTSTFVMSTVVDQLPRLGKRELICLLFLTCNYVVSVWRGFLLLWVLGMGYVILLLHSLSLPYILSTKRNAMFFGVKIIDFKNCFNSMVLPSNKDLDCIVSS